MHAFTKPADFEFSREKVLRLAEQQVHGVTSLERPRARELAIYSRTLLCARPFIAGCVNRVARVPRWSPMNEFAYPGTVATTRLVWTAVIFNSSETSGQLSNGIRYLKCAV